MAGIAMVASSPRRMTAAALSVVIRAAVTMADSAAARTAWPPGIGPSSGIAAPADPLTIAKTCSWGVRETLRLAAEGAHRPAAAFRRGRAGPPSVSRDLGPFAGEAPRVYKLD